MITVKSSVLKQRFPAPKVLNPRETNPTFVLQPKPLDGAVRNSLTSSSSESCLVFKKSAWILFLRHFQWESSCEQRGRFFSVCKIYTELLLIREQTQGHPAKEKTDVFCGIWASNTENTQTHTCIPIPIPFLVRRNCLGPSRWTSIQKDKQNRTSPTPGREERGNGGRDIYWLTVVLKGNMQKNWNLNLKILIANAKAFSYALSSSCQDLSHCNP